MGKVKSRVSTSRPATIGTAATAAGLTAKAIRLYERRGLLNPPTRTEAGYRLYTESDIARLRFIAAARSLGLHLDQIAEVLADALDGQRPCHTTRTVLDQRMSEIDNLIEGLTDLRESLATARDTPIDDRAAAICPVIEGQSGAGSPGHTGPNSG